MWAGFGGARVKGLAVRPILSPWAAYLTVNGEAYLAVGGMACPAPVGGISVPPLWVAWPVPPPWVAWPISQWAAWPVLPPWVAWPLWWHGLSHSR